MRILKVIILLTLICKSTMGLSFSLDISGTKCHSDLAMEIGSDDCPQDDDTKNCCGTVCDCLCCGHIFTFSSIKESCVVLPELTETKQPKYNFTYLHNFSITIWQPPRS